VENEDEVTSNDSDIVDVVERVLRSYGFQD